MYFNFSHGISLKKSSVRKIVQKIPSFVRQTVIICFFITRRNVLPRLLFYSEGSQYVIKMSLRSRTPISLLSFLSGVLVYVLEFTRECLGFSFHINLQAGRHSSAYTSTTVHTLLTTYKPNTNLILELLKIITYFYN